MPKFYFTLLCFFFCADVYSQSLPLNMGSIEEIYRREQLMGAIDSSLSFNVRPLHPTYLHKNHKTDSLLLNYTLLKSEKWRSKVVLLPVEIYNEYNSHHPYGWNNGSLLRSKGLQSRISGGFFAKLGPLSVQIRPEAVYFSNKDYLFFSEDLSLPYFYYTTYLVDLPERYDDRPIYRFLPGQSSAKLNVGPVSLGVSTENIWWGPGRRNSLLMSSNAQGFEHLTIHTNRPANIGIGSLEGQMIVGRLEGSGRIEKPDDWRYLSGFSFSFSPKWTPGLFMGLSRTIQQYYTDTKMFKDYYPVFMNFLRRNDSQPDYLFGRDQYASIYLRWLWKKAHAEWYFEYGRNDASWHARDFIMSPEHSRAFTLGFAKVTPLAHNRYVQVVAELTQLQQSANRLVRDAGIWYGHYPVRHGYTHRGEVLGAGIGPGSNVQFLEVSWFQDLDKVGVQLERLVNNNDFYYHFFPNSPSKQPWVDLSLGINGNRKIENFLLSGKIQYIRSFNYWWEEAPESTPFAYKGKDVSNLFLTFGVVYGFR